MRIAPLTFVLAIGFAAPAFAQSGDVSPLVDFGWLKANAGKDNVVVLDIRDKIKETDLGDKPLHRRCGRRALRLGGLANRGRRHARDAAAARPDHQADRRPRHRQ